MSQYKAVQQTDVVEEPLRQLPAVDANLSTRTQCLVAIVLGVFGSAACLSCGIVLYYLKTPQVVYNLPLSIPQGGLEAMSFVVNLVLTQICEGLAYTHSVSLRWALLQENSLEYNTNIRLFTNSKHSTPNKWYSNAISAFCLILCYASTSQLFLLGDSGIKDTVEPDNITGAAGEKYVNQPYINCVALWTLAIGLLIQALHACWCLFGNLQSIRTWSSNSLVATVSALDPVHGFIQHRPGRCMLPARSRSAEAVACQPSLRQPNLFSTRSVKWIIASLWILCLVVLVWASAILGVAYENLNDGSDAVGASLSAFSWEATENTAILSMNSDQPNGSDTPVVPFGLQFVLGILFVSVIQGVQTMALHAVELLVNMSRDEDNWRQLDAMKAKKLKGNVLNSPPFMAAFYNWKYLTLFIFKATLHWVLGQALMPTFIFKSNSSNWADENISKLIFSMNYTRLYVYAMVTIVFAAFATYLAVQKPRGPQPAAYGHIQTLADLIDNWELGSTGRFFWGDTGEVNSHAVRHAGMRPAKEWLGVIHMGDWYAGKGVEKEKGSK
jgi:hypothetical protein